MERTPSEGEPPAPDSEARGDVRAPGGGGVAAGDADILPEGEEVDASGKKPRSFARELPFLILLAFALAILVKTFLLQAFYIPSESMLPTLQVGDRVLVNKMAYRVREPRRGELIVFIAKHGEPKSFLQRVRSVLFEGLGVTRPSETDFIKRVVALPGETIEVEQGDVFITPVGGERVQIDEPYLDELPDDSSFGPFVVPPDNYFVMGDNRTNSADSRSALGPVPREEIVGKAFVRIWPLGRLGFFHRPDYAAYPAEGGTGRTTRATAA